jgi:hypothetical protein
MKKSGLNRSSKIGLIFGAILLLSQPVFSGIVSAKTPKLSRQTCDAVQGKIVGNKLMLIDKTGRQTLAPDGIYTIQGGSKITVNQGQIIDIPTRVINKSGMIGIIDIEH